MNTPFITQGHLGTQIELPLTWRQYVLAKDYQSLDQLAAQSLQQSGQLYKHMSRLLPTYFLKSKCAIEHILSLRQGPQDLDEEGIWHDDGTRVLAFSLSLNINYKSIRGEGLSLRKKSERRAVTTIPPRPFGTLHMFCTGQDGREHKTHRVEQGSRLVLAGWLT